MLQDVQLLNLLKLLYVLKNSGDYWYITISNQLKEDLKMTSLTGYLACFIRTKNDSLQGMIAVHGDDSIGIGNDSFMKYSMMTSSEFESEERGYDHITFSGIRIERKS